LRRIMREALLCRYQNYFHLRGADTRRLTVNAFIFLILLCSTAISALAQAPSGITGTVTDSSGSLVVGAQVIVKSLSTNQETRTTTTSAGAYGTTGLLPGRYTVTVTAPGFQKAVR